MNSENRTHALPFVAMLALVSACGSDPIPGEVVPAGAPSAAAAPKPAAPPEQPPAPTGTAVAPSEEPPPSPPPPPPARDPDGLSADCVTLVYETSTQLRLAVLSLDTGALVQGPPISMLGGGNNGSLAVTGDKVFVCVQGSLASIDLASGLLQKTQVACQPLTSNEAGIWSRRHPGHFKHFAGAAELLAQAPTGEVPVPVQSLARFGPGGAGRIYASGGLGPVVHLIDPLSGTAAAMSLEGLTSQIFGISAATGNRVAVSTPAYFGVGGVQTFDAATGKRLAHLHPTMTFVGLSCRARP